MSFTNSSLYVVAFKYFAFVFKPLALKTFTFAVKPFAFVFKQIRNRRNLRFCFFIGNARAYICCYDSIFNEAKQDDASGIPNF